MRHAGSPGGDQRLATTGVDLKCWVCRRTPRMWPQGLERARAEGKLAGRRWIISLARMRTIQRMRKDLGMSLAQIAQGQGMSESLVRLVLKVEDVDALPATAFKEGWD